jgi:pimeloyl-ACP methyl ester carboxylesterase
MPDVSVNGIRLHYVETGQGPETVVFSHSYLVDHRHFEAQIAGLADGYRVLAYDHRDHGGSERMTRPYGMEDIYADGVAFLEAVAPKPCHWVGLSTGGFVGLRLAIRRPDRLRSLVVMDSAGDAEPWPNRVKYGLLLAVVRFVGFGPVLGEAMKAMFGRKTLQDPERRDFRTLWRQRLTANGRRAVVRFGRAIFRRDSVEEQLGSIRVPTLVARGDQDRAVSEERARWTADAIPGARYRTLPGAGHLSTLERPDLVTEMLREHLDGILEI